LTFCRHLCRQLVTVGSHGDDEIDARFDAMQRTLLQLGGVAIAALLGLIATQL
jgi:hypothetical protein